MTRFFLLLGGLFFAGGPLFCLLWSVLPPPRYGLWIVGLIAGEWALWLGGTALIGAVVGAAVFRGGARGMGGFIVCAGIAAFVLSLVPYFQTLPVARANHTSLSWGRYFRHFPARERGAPDATEIYAAPNGVPLALDIYLPPDTTGQAGPKRRPAMVVIHGGSWKAGDKSDFPQWNRWLAQNGFVVFDVEYRLAPQPNFREATGDVKAALLWVKRNAARFNVDKNHLALLGRSAGGQLALLAACAPDDLGLPPTSSDGNQGDASVRAVVSLYGPADLEWGYYHPARYDVIDGPGTLRRYLGSDPQTVPENYALAAPINHVGPRTPPTLLFHGERDTIVGAAHAERLSARLENAHIPHQAVYFPYATHGFDYNFDGWASQVVQNVLLRFLRNPENAGTPPPLGVN